MTRRVIPAFFLFAILAGCGGGGSSSLPQTHAAPVLGGTRSGPQNVVVSIAVPAAAGGAAALKRGPLYVSAGSQSASIAVNGGTPVIASLAAGSSNCTPATGTSRTCSVTVAAPVGTDTFTEILYPSTNGTGTPLSQNQSTFTIVAGKANVVNMTLNGVVASIALSLDTPAPPLGKAATIPLHVTMNDASGATIIGSDPFVNAITLTDSDTSGATTLSRTQLASPADAAALTVTYTGATIASATFGASATGVAATAVTPATLTPAAATALVDWPTYGYDAQRSGYNPFTSAITPASIAQLHIGWQTAINGSTQTQPIVVTNVAGHQALLIVGNFAVAQAYDALSGALVWQRTLPTQDVQDCGNGGISGTIQYDKALSALFMAAGNGGGAPNHTILYRLDAATGGTTGQVDITPTLLPGEAAYGHSGITLANGRIYLGTGSNCEGTATGKYPSWRGRVVSVDPSSMTLLSTFFTTYGQGGNFGGGGVWGWGGVSADAGGNIYVATGNAETNAATAPQTAAAPFQTTDDEQAGYSEHLIKLSADLSTVESSNYPGFNFNNGGDLDYSGTPVIYQPSVTAGCGAMSATQGKGGTVVINNTQDLTEVNSFALSVPNGSAYYIGNPAFSPNTGYVYAAISSSGAGSSLLPPGLAAIGPCGASIVWHAQFGPDSALLAGERPRSAPTVTAGGVVFIGTPCQADVGGGCGGGGAIGGAVWAVDATTGSLLGGGKPVLITADNIRMAPSADGQWLFVLDGSGNLTGLTIDPSVKAAAAIPGRRVPSRLRFHEK
jgi:hypothetical protein